MLWSERWLLWLTNINRLFIRYYLVYLIHIDNTQIYHIMTETNSSSVSNHNSSSLSVIDTSISVGRVEIKSS